MSSRGSKTNSHSVAEVEVRPLEEVKEAMEEKLGVLEKREMAWREEKREALADLDMCKERMREVK